VLLHSLLSRRNDIVLIIVGLFGKTLNAFVEIVDFFGSGLYAVVLLSVYVVAGFFNALADIFEFFRSLLRVVNSIFVCFNTFQRSRSAETFRLALFFFGSAPRK